MDESHCNSSEYEYDNCGSSPTHAGQEDFEHSNGRSEACAADTDDEVTDCLHFKGKKYEDLVLEDLEGVEFKSVEEVDQFYSYYSLATGFSVRKHKADKNSEQKVRRRQLLCSRAGERRSHVSKKQKLSTDRDNWREDNSCQSQTRTNAALSRRVTRCNCPARFTALLCKTRGVFYASEFVTEHNHDLVRPEHVRFLRSHRKVMDHDIAQVSAMRKVSIPTCQAYDLLAEQAGGYAYEILLSHRMSGVTTIQQDLVEPRNRDCRSQLDFAPSLVPIDCGASRVWAAEYGVSEPNKHDGILGAQPKEVKVQPKVHSTLSSAADEQASTGPANEEGRLLQATTVNPIAGACTNEVCVETEQPSRRCDRKKQPSVSLREEDVIYGSWKRTKSA